MMFLWASPSSFLSNESPSTASTFISHSLTCDESTANNTASKKMNTISPRLTLKPAETTVFNISFLISSTLLRWSDCVRVVLWGNTDEQIKKKQFIKELFHSTQSLTSLSKTSLKTSFSCNEEMFSMTHSSCTCSFTSHDFIKKWNFFKPLLSGELKGWEQALHSDSLTERPIKITGVVQGCRAQTGWHPR